VVSRVVGAVRPPTCIATNESSKKTDEYRVRIKPANKSNSNDMVAQAAHTTSATPTPTELAAVRAVTNSNISSAPDQNNTMSSVIRVQALRAGNDGEGGDGGRDCHRCGRKEG